jgi:hypothetical protein
MAWYNFFGKKDRLDEEIKSFANKGDKLMTPAEVKRKTGEGVEDIQLIQGYGAVGLQTFNIFYDRYINSVFNNELERIKGYRQMSEMSEISDVIEDAINESTQEDLNGDIITLDILDNDLNKNENIVSNIQDEFYELFYNNIDIERKLWDILRSYFIDGRVFYERIIDTSHQKKGIIGIKKLPTESMDYMIDPFTGEIVKYFQYLTENKRRPLTIEEAEQSKEVIVFNKNQISFINYGVYGKNKYEILGYLEKAKIPYNQLKLLETSVIIYRIVRAPERLVFRIDTGNMPMDKAMKFVEKVKDKMTKKVTYDSETGQLTQQPDVMSIQDNYYVPQSADGHGSQVESVGGGSVGFTELDDIYYFARKLYRALKYPLSRVSASQEKREGDVLFGGNQTAEISRDEIKWAKFLERQQARVCDDFMELFLLHMDFKGLKDQYDLDRSKLDIKLTPPSHYKQQMDQAFLTTSFENYNSLADRGEISKYFCMRKYLGWDEDTIKDNAESFKKDRELGFVKDENSMY